MGPGAAGSPGPGGLGGDSRVLWEADELARLDAELADRGGYLPIAAVRALVRQNTLKETFHSGAENCVADAELLMELDARIDYPVFVAGDEVLTREELLARYPFGRLGTTPEAVFVRQEIGAFGPGGGGAAREYLARDAGDAEGFARVEDLLGPAGAGGGQPREPLRVAATKIHLGKERWESFTLLARLYRGAAEILAPQLEDGPAAPGWRPLLALMPGAAHAGEEARLARGERALDALEARAAALDERAAALAAREEGLRVRETGLFAVLGLPHPEDAPGAGAGDGAAGAGGAGPPPPGC